MMPSFGSGGLEDSGYQYSDRLSGWVLNFFPYKKTGKPFYQFSELSKLSEIYDRRANGEHFIFD